jgi:hypothetical protein
VLGARALTNHILLVVSEVPLSPNSNVPQSTHGSTKPSLCKAGAFIHCSTTMQRLIFKRDIELEEILCGTLRRKCKSQTRNNSSLSHANPDTKKIRFCLER